MYRRRIQSNLGHKTGRDRVPHLDRAQNAIEMKARYWDSISIVEAGIMTASGIHGIYFDKLEHIQMVSLKEGGVSPRDREDIQTWGRSIGTDQFNKVKLRR